MNTPAHNLNDSRIFLTGALQGFPSGGHIIEQILYLDKKREIIICGFLGIKKKCKKKKINKIKKLAFSLR